MSTPKVNGFFGEYRFLSNFYPCEIEYEGLKYNSVEHAYQAAKSDLAWERKALSCTPGSGKKVMSAKEAKIFGKKVSMRHNWDNVKLSVMEELCRQKFTNHEDLKAKLLATDDQYLEETNYWGDRFYGVCGGSGQNHLGKIHMKIRKELQNANRTREDKSS